MKILWSSNAVWANTGYGVQARHLLPRLKALGHDVAQFAWYGLSGAIIETPDFRIYPAYQDSWGFDVLNGHVKHFGADLVIDLRDIWVCPPDYIEQVRPARWCCWFPVDHDPIPPLVLDRARTADYPITYSEFGQRMARQAGLDCPNIPHGISDVYLECEISKGEAREKLGIDQGAYLVTMVAANKSNPSRKGFPEALQAFGRFAADKPEAVLYLHTQENNANGVDFMALLPACDVAHNQVRFSDQYAQAIGVVGEDKMAWIYRASDVLLAASKNEGFGIPIVEAQAVGTPVVTTDFTSMPELTWNGIATPPAQRAWTPLDSWVAVPSVDNIYDALVEIHDWSEAERIQWREYGQERAAAFQWDRLVAEYWAPMLEQIESEIEASK